MAKFAIYFKFDFINRPNHLGGGDWPNTADMQTYFGQALTLVAAYGFDAVITRPEEKNQWSNVTFRRWFMDQCQTLGLEVWYRAKAPSDASRDGVAVQAYIDNIYTHPACTRVMYGDETKGLDAAPEKDILSIRTELAVVKAAFPSMPVSSNLIGETMARTEITVNPFDGNFDYEVDFDINGVLWGLMGADFKVARHYSVRRTYNHNTNPYYDKYIIKLEDWLDELNWRDSNGVPVIQGFGSGTAVDNASFWRFPTYTELYDMLNLARQRFNWVAIFSVGQIDNDTRTANPAFQIMNEDFSEPLAHDGSRPADAVRDIISAFGT